LGIRNIKLVF